ADPNYDPHSNSLSDHGTKHQNDNQQNNDNGQNPSSNSPSDHSRADNMNNPNSNSPSDHVPKHHNDNEHNNNDHDNNPSSNGASSYDQGGQDGNWGNNQSDNEAICGDNCANTRHHKPEHCLNWDDQGRCSQCENEHFANSRGNCDSCWESCGECHDH